MYPDGGGHPARADLVFARVREELEAGGCVVCRLGGSAERRFLDNLLYERVNDPQTRQDLRASWGFCARHAWMLPAQRSPVLGVALLYQDLLRVLRTQLDAWSLGLSGRPRAASRMPGALKASAPCPACAHRERMEHVYLASLLEHVEDPEVGRALSGPAPLCLRHFLRATSLATGTRARLRLLELHAQALALLERDLAELVRKHDYRFREEGLTSGEASSWLRVLEVFGGADPCADRSPPDLRPRPTDRGSPR